LAAGDLPAARAAADELGRLGGLLGATFLEALAGQAEATVLRAEGRPREALTAARRAWSLWRRLDVPFEAARSRLTVSLSNRDLGDHDGAETELAAARGLFEQLHADSALRFVEPVEPHPMAASDHGLTPREVEVLRLVAEGKSNRDIAGDLVLSEKTVARHLANIFVKLDVSSRTAATAYAFHHDLV
jgi:ATP/maltotriose-dependent transcriptional regulator MalT